MASWAAGLVSKSKQTAREPDYTAHAAEAQALYAEGCTPQGPAWSMLGQELQRYWMKRAYLKAQGVEDWWSIEHERT